MPAVAAQLGLVARIEEEAAQIEEARKLVTRARGDLHAPPVAVRSSSPHTKMLTGVPGSRRGGRSACRRTRAALKHRSYVLKHVAAGERKWPKV